MHGTVDLLRRARRLDGDGRHLDGDGAVAAEQVDDRSRVILRARDEDAPAEQGLDLEPVELVPLRDDLADDEEPRTGLTRRLRRGGDLAERRHDRALVDRRAAARDGDREAGVSPGGRQSRGDVGGSIGPVEEDDRRAGRGELGPGQVGVVRVDDPHLADPTPGEAEARVRRDSRDLAHAGRDLEVDARLAQRAGLVEEGAVDHRITRDEAHGGAALARRLDHERTATGLIQGHAVGVDRHGDLGIRAGVGARDGHRVRVDDDQVGGGDEAGCPEGQQVRVPGTGGDQRDRPVHRLLAGLGGLDHRARHDLGDRLGRCRLLGDRLGRCGLLRDRLGRLRVPARDLAWPAPVPARDLAWPVRARPSSRPASRPWRARPSSRPAWRVRPSSRPACCWRLSLSCVDRLSQRICVK